MKLVDNWKSAWKWVSIQLVLAGASLQAAVLAFPDVKDWLGDTVTHCVGLLILAGIAVGRLVDQSKPAA